MSSVSEEIPSENAELPANSDELSEAGVPKGYAPSNDLKSSHAWLTSRYTQFRLIRAGLWGISAASLASAIFAAAILGGQQVRILVIPFTCAVTTAVGAALIIDSVRYMRSLCWIADDTYAPRTRVKILSVKSGGSGLLKVEIRRDALDDNESQTTNTFVATLMGNSLSRTNIQSVKSTEYVGQLEAGNFGYIRVRDNFLYTRHALKIEIANDTTNKTTERKQN